LLEEGRTPEEAEEVGDLADSLAEMLRRYEAALKDHGIERPYNGAFKRLG
jgi:hypothetical protein